MTSYRLKIIAMIAMTIDHAAGIIGQMGLMSLFPELSLGESAQIIGLMHGIGRMAFPLFAFLLAEGAGKTRSMPKYIGRLVLFALVSEPFFYCALSLEAPTFANLWDNICSFRFGNVFFTLVLGAAAIYVYQLLERRKMKCRWLVFVPACLTIALAGEAIGCDYGMSGILLIVALYLVKTKTQKSAVVLVWAVALYILGQTFVGTGFRWSQLSARNVANCLWAASSCLLFCRYNGSRGKPLKWCFYIYYPAHLLLLSQLAAVIRR